MKRLSQIFQSQKSAETPAKSKLFVNSIASAFPPKKMSVSEDPRIPDDQKKLLVDMGFDQYHLGSPEYDAVELLALSGRAALEKAPQEKFKIDMFLGNAVGNHRGYGDWSIAAYLQSRFELSGCPGMMVNSSCASVPVAMTLFDSLMQTNSQMKTALISSSSSVFPPLAQSLAAADVERQKSIAYGAASTSVVISRSEGPIEIIGSSIGISYVDETSWGMPTAFHPFQYADGKVVAGGEAFLDWSIGAKKQESNYVFPSQKVLFATMKSIAECVKENSIKELTLSCIPIGFTPFEKILSEMTGIPVKKRNDIYSIYGHCGATDPLLNMDHALQNHLKGYTCHLCIGQGYTGAFVLFKI